MMKLLTRPEEFVLLAIWRLQEEAYTLPICTYLGKITGKKWSLGSVYTPIERLARRGYIDSYTTEPTAERGGRHRRIYRLTGKGRQALLEVRSVEASIWEGITAAELQGGRS